MTSSCVCLRGVLVRAQPATSICIQLTTHIQLVVASLHVDAACAQNADGGERLNTAHRQEGKLGTVVERGGRQACNGCAQC